MIRSGLKGRISCSVPNCKRGQAVDLNLTVRGGWAAVRPDKWQIGVDPKDVMGVLIARCPDHRIEPNKIQEPTPEQTAALLHP
jgi:hypothetical protein